MSKTSKKTYFDELWLKDERLGQWLQQVPKDRTCFRCKLCSKVLKLSNMGIEAIKSHESNAKHRGLAAVVFAAAPIQSFLQPSTLSSAVAEFAAQLKTCTQLSKVDLPDRSHHKQVDLGFSAEMYLQSAEFRKMISDKDVLGIRISAKAALITFTEKVLE
ncbi:hypothetical protein EMCRGX_G018850 [Ephydatia muelleri]